MVDLHAHILPGIDDGPKTADEALTMCRMAESDGITTVVATPHTGNGIYRNTREGILTAVAGLNDLLDRNGVALNILPGADVHISPDITDRIVSGAVTTVNDARRYVLIEIPDQIIPPNLDEFFFGVKLKGITPILTHPERNRAIQDDVNLLRKWIELGVVMQITAMSVTGDFGSSIERTAEKMLDCRMVHVIASDAHSPGRRPPVLSRAKETAARIVGKDYADDLVNAHPRSIVEGKALDLPYPVERKTSFFSRFFGR